MGPRRTCTAVLVVLLVAALAAPAGADDYDDPFFLGWSAFTPAVPGDFVASTERDCPTGSNRCVDQVIREMERRWSGLDCHHDAVFALTYLLTTREYRRAVEDPQFFGDNAFVNHQDAIFADLYFQPHDAWRHGRLEEVPPAWRIAFRAAEQREVSGTGDILLGMNAHIRRDLPFVLHAIGLVKPDGTSRKADHDRVNLILNRVAPAIFEETAARYDPTIDDGDVPGTSIDQSTMLQTVVEWREEAWRKAELLANARSDSELLEIARWIERDAAASALALRELYRYDGLLSDTAARDAHCEAHLTGTS